METLLRQPKLIKKEKKTGRMNFNIMTKPIFLQMFVHLIVFFGGQGVKLDMPCTVQLIIGNVLNYQVFIPCHHKALNI